MIFNGAGFAAAALVFSLVLITLPGIRAADATSLEYQVKAAFLLNFTKFVDWPAGAFSDARAPINICILGEDRFGPALDQIVQGEIVNGRRLTVQRIRRASEAKCQVLYIQPSEKDAAEVLSGLGPGVLTVGEGDAFVRQGGIIGFVVENRHVRFDINQAAATNAAITLSSRLLNVARTVTNRNPEARP